MQKIKKNNTENYTYEKRKSPNGIFRKRTSLKREHLKRGSSENDKSEKYISEQMNAILYF